MIHVEQHGPVLAIRMSRAFLRQPFWWTTAYWVDGLLIDAGPRFAARELCYALSKLTVDAIVVTHSHEDQIGGLAALRQRYPQAKLYASAHALAILQEPQRQNLPLYRRWLWGAPTACGPVISFDEVNNVIQSAQYTFRVVETPGHTLDHVALFEPKQRWLFSGDTYSSGHEKAWPASIDLFSVVCSLRTLASLRPERLFPTDGRISRTPFPELHGKIGYYIHLAREVAQLESAGFTAPEINARLFGKEPPIHFWTMGHYSTTHLLNACHNYNTLFTFVDRVESPRASSALADESHDAPDSSTDWPVDWEDLIR